MAVTSLYAHAETVQLTLETKAVRDTLTINIHNRGDVTINLSTLEVSLAGNTVIQQIDKTLTARERMQLKMAIEQPEKKGMYPLLTTVHYQDSHLHKTIVGAGIYYHRVNALPPQKTCFIPERSLSRSALLPVKHTNAKQSNIVLHTPKEILWKQIGHTEKKSMFHLHNVHPTLLTTHTIFAIISELGANGETFTSICKGSVLFPRNSHTITILSSIYYFIFGWIFLLAALFLAHTSSRTPQTRSEPYFLCRWAFSLAIFCMATALWLGLWEPVDLFLASSFFLSVEEYFSSSVIFAEGKYLLEYLFFTSPAFNYFAEWFFFPLLTYFLFFNYFVIKYLHRDLPQDDKYWQLTLCILKAFRTNTQCDVIHYRQQSAALGARSLLVKYFFTPLLAGWLIQNIEHIVNLGWSFEGRFHQIVQFAIAAIILIDVLVFTCGYLTELPQLNNQIVSVDATFFGWFICLICYPPLNQIMFSIFDTTAPPDFLLNHLMLEKATLLCVLLLWLCYVWASVALGFKASNLTNRGIVDSGPYAYIRHPAYAAKVLLWILSCFLLGEKSIPLVTLLAVVYGLRAWTEERHLNQDPAYQRYKEHVPYALIPKLF